MKSILFKIVLLISNNFGQNYSLTQLDSSENYGVNDEYSRIWFVLYFLLPSCRCK